MTAECKTLSVQKWRQKYFEPLQSHKCFKMWPRVWNILHQKKEFTNNLVISRKGLENQFKREFKTQQPLDIEGVLNSSSTDVNFKKYF